MSFVSELHEALDGCWPVASNHPLVDSLNIDINPNDGTIGVLISLETGHTIEERMDYNEDCSVLAEAVAKRLRKIADHRLRVAKEALSHAEQEAQENKEVALAIRGLAASPLEELASQAE